MRPVLVLSLLAAASALPRDHDDEAKHRLPKGFLLGGGTSSFQAEGAWNEDGKGPNVFDHAYHAYNISENGDVASDTYHRYKEDIDLAAEIGFNVFRFSISWARIFPNGRKSGGVNQKGVQYYHDFLDKLKEKNMQPIVTISHFDHPQALQEEFKGWVGDEMPDVFAEYAEFLFETYGSKVKYWLTVNEAAFYCFILGDTFFIPRLYTTTEDQNACLKNTLFAHAKAYTIYEEKFKKTQKGMVGYGTGPLFFRPLNSSSPDDVALAENSNERFGIALPIDALIFGDFPESVKTTRNIALTDDEKKLIRGRVDFLGINSYGGTNVSATGGGDNLAGAISEVVKGGGGVRPDGFGGVAAAWALRIMPMWVQNRYGKEKPNLPIFITENGVQTSGNGSEFNDWDSRAVYCSAFLREMAAGINENKTQVFGYTLWSFIDTFEFHGFSNFGVVHVDFADKTLKRTKKASWTFFRRVMDTGVVPLVEEGSEPFPAPSGASALAGSIALVFSLVFVRLLR